MFLSAAAVLILLILCSGGVAAQEQTPSAPQQEQSAIVEGPITPTDEPFTWPTSNLSNEWLDSFTAMSAFVTAGAAIVAAWAAVRRVRDAQNASRLERRAFLSIQKVQLLTNYKNLIQIIIKNTGQTLASGVMARSWHRRSDDLPFIKDDPHGFGISDPGGELFAGVRLPHYYQMSQSLRSVWR
ncbi:hypothetical protein [Rhizobium sp. Root483D2]|uniref:hypothetical protein n=1 Tax=Rhizobium sp. Root483D2 TaxID=1736545 RepID=UPI0012E3E06E|nr:hypothetical protein [Rhizobium sp. Root483D2]